MTDATPEEVTHDYDNELAQLRDENERLRGELETLKTAFGIELDWKVVVGSADGPSVSIDSPGGNRVRVNPTTQENIDLIAELAALCERVKVLGGTDFHRFASEQSAWSQATFGTDAERGPTGPAKHLAKEVLCELLGVQRCDADEILRGTKVEPVASPEEFADCLFLILDSSRRAGFTSQELLAAAFEKLAVNKARTWPKPTSDEPVEHVRNPAAIKGGQ